MRTPRAATRLPTGGPRALYRDLRLGAAGPLTRIVLCALAALAILSATTLWLMHVERRDGWIPDRQLTLAQVVATAVWLAVVGGLWRHVRLRDVRRWITGRRLRAVAASGLVIGAIWAVLVPVTVALSSGMAQGDGRGYLIATGVLSGLTASLGAMVGWWYRPPPPRGPIVRLRLSCPRCAHSLRGLRRCRCPECGAVFTLEQLLEHLGRGRVRVD